MPWRPLTEKKEIIMYKQICFAATLALVGTLSFGTLAQAQQPIKKSSRLNLPCTITKGGDVQSQVRVENNSNLVIPAGTKINVQIAGASLPNLLQTSLATGASRNLSGPADHGGGCKAQATVVTTY